MNLFQRTKAKIKYEFSGFYSRLPLKGGQNPVFIIGCGRSGTTILGRTLAEHPRVKYLNEPGISGAGRIRKLMSGQKQEKTIMEN